MQDKTIATILLIVGILGLILILSVGASAQTPATDRAVDRVAANIRLMLEEGPVVEAFPEVTPGATTSQIKLAEHAGAVIINYKPGSPAIMSFRATLRATGVPAESSQLAVREIYLGVRGNASQDFQWVVIEVQDRSGNVLARYPCDVQDKNHQKVMNEFVERARRQAGDDGKAGE
jgi:hypothetical protein